MAAAWTGLRCGVVVPGEAWVRLPPSSSSLAPCRAVSSTWGLTSGWVLPRASTVQPSVPQNPRGAGSTLVSLEGFPPKTLNFFFVIVSQGACIFFSFTELRLQCCYCCCCCHVRWQSKQKTSENFVMFGHNFTQFYCKIDVTLVF